MKKCIIGLSGVVALATSFVILSGFCSPSLYFLLFWLAVGLWLTYLPFAVLTIANILRGLRKYVSKPKEAPIHLADPIIFQVTTRNIKNCGHSLVSVIRSIRESCEQASLDDYEIAIVTDSNDGTAVFNKTDEVDIIVVPGDYVAAGAIRKARALQYANEVRRRQDKNSQDYWVFHLDEESHISVQTIEALKSFITQGKGLIGTGPIFYPNHFNEASVLTRFAESIRPTGCYICCNQRIPVHMHGSNLLIRADVEDAVGWKNGETLAEDQLFGLKVYEKYGAVFGWHGGAMYEQPPMRVEDMLNQRKRWFVGTWTNLKHFDPKIRAKVVFGMLTWVLGLASAVMSFPYWIITLMAIPNFFFPQLPFEIPFQHHTPVLTPVEILVDCLQGDIHKYLTLEHLLPLSIGLVLSICFFTWVGGYIIGLYWNTRTIKVSRLTKIRWHFQQLLLLPIVGLLETLAAILAIRDLFKGKTDWIPTPKE